MTAVAKPVKKPSSKKPVKAKSVTKQKASAKSAKKPVAKQAAVKPVKAGKAETKPAKEKKIGCLSAAAAVLAASSVPMRCEEIIAEAAAKKLWVSPDGKTPANTLRAAINREIAACGSESRFVKADRGLFRLA